MAKKPRKLSEINQNPQPQPGTESPSLLLPPPQPQPADYSPGSGPTQAGDAQPDFDGILNELGPEPSAQPDPALLTKDQFFQGFGGMFTMASAMTGLQSLHVSQDDASARGASDAIYDTAAEIPMFRFLISPGNLYVQRALVVLAFAVPKYQAVTAEAAARRSMAQAARREERAERPVMMGAVHPGPVSDPLAPDFGAGTMPGL